MIPVVGDLVMLEEVRRTSIDAEVGQVIHQSDIMSDILTSKGVVKARTSRLTVIQPGHVEFSHTQGRGMRA